MGTADSARGPFGDALKECADGKFSGVLRVDGRPGGAVYFDSGKIVACHTPAAPSLEVIVLRTGRIPESDWNAAFTAAAVSGNQMTAELTDRGLVGAGELEALLRVTVADAVFALFAGRTVSWHTELSAEGHPLPLSPAAHSGWLVAEAARRVKVLTSFPGPVLSAADRVAVTSAAARRGRLLGQGRDEILAFADGRRTARDLAFALGSGLYATMLQLAGMRADGLIVTSPADKASQQDDGLEARPGTGNNEQADAELPRRRRDRAVFQLASGVSRRNTAGGLQILRPRSERNMKPDGTQ